MTERDREGGEKDGGGGEEETHLITPIHPLDDGKE